MQWSLSRLARPSTCDAGIRRRLCSRQRCATSNHPPTACSARFPRCRIFSPPHMHCFPTSALSFTIVRGGRPSSRHHRRAPAPVRCLSHKSAYIHTGSLRHTAAVNCRPYACVGLTKDRLSDNHPPSRLPSLYMIIVRAPERVKKKKLCAYLDPRVPLKRHASRDETCLMPWKGYAALERSNAYAENCECQRELEEKRVHRSSATNQHQTHERGEKH